MARTPLKENVSVFENDTGASILETHGLNAMRKGDFILMHRSHLGKQGYSSAELRYKMCLPMVKQRIGEQRRNVAFWGLLLTACSNPGVVSDASTENQSVDAGIAVEGGAFVHPGLLHSEADFVRMQSKVVTGAEPWKAGWEILVANNHASLTWTPRPTAAVYRGADGTHPENYTQLFHDAAAAYATALRWKISGEVTYAEKSIQILDAWSGTLTLIAGTSDRFLASGLYGYQLANAAEIMRTYAGWEASNFKRFQTLMRDVFYPMNHDFLVHHNNACMSHYWANWDLANLASMLAIGVFLDDRAIYNEALEYYRNGAGNGAVSKFVYYLHPDGFGQWQESGRDQPHSMLGIGLAGTICEMAYKQGDDLYGESDNRFLAGIEYVARYNLGFDVPFVPYSTCDPVTHVMISPTGRGELRPIWEMVFNHFVRRRGLSAPNAAAMAEKVRPEGGGGNYGPNSGGFDSLGYGTLAFTLE